MQIRRFGYRIRGFAWPAGYARRWAMVAEKAKHRARVLQFWAQHRLPATIEAFQVKRHPPYSWKQRLKKGNGQIGALKMSDPKLPVKNENAVGPSPSSRKSAV